MTTLSYTRNGQSFAIESDTLSPESIAYLLQYGWAQSLQDSIAGREKKVRDEYSAKEAELPDDTTDDQLARFHDERELAVMADIEGQLSKRMDAIVNNTISVRGVGEQRDPLKAVAQDMVRKAAASKGIKIAKELLVAKANELLETKRDVVQAEYNRRKETAIEIDLD